VVLRFGGEAVAVPDTDVPWAVNTPGEPVKALRGLLTEMISGKNRLEREERRPVELLMPGADVLAALAGQPDLQPWTAPIPLRADQVDVGQLVIGFSKEHAEELVTGVLECEDDTCPCFECCVIVVDGVEPVHFDGY